MSTTAKQIAKDIVKKVQRQAQEVNESAGIQGSQMAKREKYWGEIELSEKIERLRALVKGQMEANQRLSRELDKVKRHSHNEKGEAVIVQSLNDYGRDEISGGSLQGIKQPDDVYI